MQYCCLLQLEGTVFHLLSFCSAELLNYVESRMWSKPVTLETGPSPRDKLASAVVGDNIYYFGGFGPKTSPAVRNCAFALHLIYCVLITIKLQCLISDI